MLIGSVQRRWISVAAFVAAVVVLAASAVAQGSLERRIGAAVEKARLGKAVVGVSIVDADTERELATFSTGDSADSALIPASNLKLLTTGAALLTLGPEFEFRTSFVLVGDQLVIEGCGDPALADPDLLSKMQTGIEQFLDRLADSIAAAAKGRIAHVVIDDRVFDRELVHPTWPIDQLNRAYCAPVCGVNFHRNILNVFPSPASRAGEPPSLRTEPAAPWIEFDRQRARTIREGDTAVWIERGSSPWQFRLHGAVRSAPTDAVRVAVREPAPIFGRLLADRIAARQRGATPIVRLVEQDEPLASTQPGATVAAIVRTPISVVLERCNVDSDNLYAEAMLKLTGHHVTRQPGSWSNGAAVVRMILKDRIGSQHAASALSHGSACPVGLGPPPEHPPRGSPTSPTTTASASRTSGPWPSPRKRAHSGGGSATRPSPTRSAPRAGTSTACARSRGSCSRPRPRGHWSRPGTAGVWPLQSSSTKSPPAQMSA